MISHQIFNNVLSESQIKYINDLPEVLAARQTIESGAKIAQFNVTLNYSIKNTLQERLGINLSQISQIPMRWIKGDTSPHIDGGRSTFDNTYLLYLNNSIGEFLLESESYPILANTAFVFKEGLRHETLNTGNEPRLLLGPMSESGFAVGSAIYYYSTEADALSQTSQIAYGGDFYFVVGDLVGGGGYGSIGSITSWRLASNSNGSSSKTAIYNNYDVLNNDGNYYLYPSVICFLEGSKILCQVDGVDKYQTVETLRPGTLVKTSCNGYKKVELISKSTIYNLGNSDRNEDRLYKCSPTKYPELSEDLIITGCHSILEFPITEKQKEDSIRMQGKMYVTDNKYRLMACIDERAEPWNNEGTFTIWHFALENENDRMNYGVYANGGLLVETCNLWSLKNKSNMKIV